MTFPCPLCGKHVAVRQTKKQKPYLVCQDCGVQMFVRYVTGITRLYEESGDNHDLPADDPERPAINI